MLRGKTIVNKQTREFRKKWKEIREKTKVSKCLFSQFGGCSEKIIRAHSIQNNKILSKIATNGEVKVFWVEAHSSLIGDLDTIGRKVATTFSGFCGAHDTKLFSEIENKDYLMNNKKQEFLFAYRALCRELIVKEEQKNIFEYIQKNFYLPNIEKFLKGIEIGLSDLQEVKDLLDQSLLKEEFGAIKSIVICLDEECNFSVASAFNLEYDLENNLVNDLSNIAEKGKPLFLTIFPQNDKTYILLSYLKKDADIYKLFRNQVLNLSDKEITEKISWLITLYCENFVYSPEKWKILSDEDKKIFMEIFKESAFRSHSNYMSSKPPLNFFG